MMGLTTLPILRSMWRASSARGRPVSCWYWNMWASASYVGGRRDILEQSVLEECLLIGAELVAQNGLVLKVKYLIASFSRLCCPTVKHQGQGKSVYNISSEFKVSLYRAIATSYWLCVNTSTPKMLERRISLRFADNCEVYESTVAFCQVDAWQPTRINKELLQTNI